MAQEAHGPRRRERFAGSFAAGTGQSLARDAEHGAHRRADTMPTGGGGGAGGGGGDLSMSSSGSVSISRPYLDRYTFRSSKSTTRDQEAGADDASGPRLMSLSDLIRPEDKVPATFYEVTGDADVVSDAREDAERMPNSVAVGSQEALLAAEHGNSVRLSKYLQDDGDPAAVSRLHHMRWSLLHLAAGCASMGGTLSFAYRSRPEPDCTDGYANCISALLAAGADPNVTSRPGGYTPLMGACLTGSQECCRLLLMAGARTNVQADKGKTAFDFAQKARYGASSGQESVLAVLQSPPPKMPRSPLHVTARLPERHFLLEPEDDDPIVEVRWKVPSQDSLLPTRCGDVEFYKVKCWCRGRAVDVKLLHSFAGEVLETRRDFCRNQSINRGIALRKNLSLPQSPSFSTVIHGLIPGEQYSFTVSCAAEIDGSLRQSPPSVMSKPVVMPLPKEENHWSVGGVLSRITAKDGGEELWQRPDVQQGEQQEQYKYGMAHSHKHKEVLEDLRSLSITRYTGEFVQRDQAYATAFSSGFRGQETKADWFGPRPLPSEREVWREDQSPAKAPGQGLQGGARMVSPTGASVAGSGGGPSRTAPPYRPRGDKGKKGKGTQDEAQGCIIT